MGDEIFLNEYNSLRSELADNKRYMFERPVLTVIAIISVTQFTDSPYINLIPIVAIGVLLFNLVFTATRVDSYIRYIVYIQIFHEQM